MPKTKGLLSSFVPSEYKLKLKLDQRSNCYLGELTIIGRKVGKPSHRITLHQKKLKVTGADVLCATKKGVTLDINVSRVNQINSFEQVRIHTKQVIYPGIYTLHLKYSTAVATGPADDLAQQIAEAITKGSARSWLPCVDEAAAWATAKVSVNQDL